MSQDELSGPDLAGVVADANAVGLKHVVIGGFSVRTSAQHLRVVTRHGIVDLMRGGLPPLDYETVAARAVTEVWEGEPVRVAALPSVVGFKRLAGRAQDRADLEELEAIHGELPVEPIPGLDS